MTRPPHAAASLRGRPAGAADLPAIVALHESALAADGGTPFAAAEWLLRRWYLDGVSASLAVFRDDELAGICACRPGQPDGCWTSRSPPPGGLPPGALPPGGAPQLPRKRRSSWRPSH